MFSFDYLLAAFWVAAIMLVTAIMAIAEREMKNDLQNY